MNTYFGVTPADAQASGLGVYQAEAGIRDVRGWLVALVHLSPAGRWEPGSSTRGSRMKRGGARSSRTGVPATN
jgi:outer membrane scaffolding protein for murein synthesis (MipA/OmpV family)